MSREDVCLNTDRELWRERDWDYYADSIHVTKAGGIGIDCGGTVFVKSLREWHKLAAASAQAPLTLKIPENIRVQEVKASIVDGQMQITLQWIESEAER